MLLLEGNDLWVNLKTSFVDIDALLLFLKNRNSADIYTSNFPTANVPFLSRPEMLSTEELLASFAKALF